MVARASAGRQSDPSPELPVTAWTIQRSRRLLQRSKDAATAYFTSLRSGHFEPQASSFKRWKLQRQVASRSLKWSERCITACGFSRSGQDTASSGLRLLPVHETQGRLDVAS